MKKVIAILMLLVLLVSLCACGEDHVQPGASTAAPTTQCDHVYTETVKKEATCEEAGIKSFACDKCNDIYTEAIEKLAHTYADATCTAPKTCTVCGATEGEPAAHTFADATCAAPKTCTVCGATEGEATGHSFADATCGAAKTCTVCGATEGQALGHSFTQGKCARCGTAQPGYKALTSCGWTTAGLTPSGEELDVITLGFSGEESTIGAGYYEPIDKLDKDLQDELLKYPEDLYDFGGKKYKSMGFGDWRPISYTEQGDTVVVSILEDVVIGTITMVRTGPDQYTITAITGRIIDDTITKCLSVGSVFVAK